MCLMYFTIDTFNKSKYSRWTSTISNIESTWSDQEIKQALISSHSNPKDKTNKISNRKWVILSSKINFTMQMIRITSKTSITIIMIKIQTFISITLELKATKGLWNQTKMGLTSKLLQQMSSSYLRIILLNNRNIKDHWSRLRKINQRG